tara:strand:- start:51 stop:566 length:516 start_codon:yes stop_codon:yes gene_type:complete
MGSTLTVDNIVGATTAANVKLPAGHMVQYVVNQTMGQQTISTVNTYTDIGNSATTITPKFNNSKVKIDVSMDIAINKLSGASGYGDRLQFRLVKNGSSLFTITENHFWVANNSDSRRGRIHFQATDTVSSTSATVYKVQIYVRGTASSTSAQLSPHGASELNEISLTEISQ